MAHARRGPQLHHLEGQPGQGQGLKHTPVRNVDAKSEVCVDKYTFYMYNSVWSYDYGNGNLIGNKTNTLHFHVP